MGFDPHPCCLNDLRQAAVMIFVAMGQQDECKVFDGPPHANY